MGEMEERGPLADGGAAGQTRDHTTGAVRDDACRSEMPAGRWGASAQTPDESRTDAWPSLPRGDAPGHGAGRAERVSWT